MKVDVEQFMKLAQAQDWSAFDALDPQVRDGVDPDLLREQQDLEAQRVAQAAARIFDSDDGRLVLETVLDQTLRRQVYFSMLGVDPMQVAMFGAFREGQNALVTELLRLIAAGRGETPPPKRGQDVS